MVDEEERDKHGELYGELAEIVLQLGRVYILSLCTSKNISLLNLLVSQFCAHEVNCVIIQAPRNYTLYPFNIYLITVAAARVIYPLTSPNTQMKLLARVNAFVTNINQQRRVY